RGVAVTDYLRAQMYRDRGEPGLGRELLRSIPMRHSAAMCHGCGLCDQACNKHLRVADQIRRHA
ncbi:MAG: hypothetical protein HYU66_28535, partial [Armatimonadetes bacterium]|nr:hypothetical protein [Armatimonadota bacterium]